MTHEEIFLSTPIAAAWGVKPPNKKLKPVLRPHEIISTVEKHLNIPYSDMQLKEQTTEIVKARQLAMSMLRFYTTLSLKAIGSLFEGRETGKGKDHTTVLYALQKVSDARETDPKVSHLFDVIQSELNDMIGVEIIIPIKKFMAKSKMHKEPVKPARVQPPAIYSNRSPMGIAKM